MKNARREWRRLVVSSVAVLAIVLEAESDMPASAELPPLITNCEMRVNRTLTGRRAYYYCDDAIWFLRDLARQKPKSIFDNPFLKALKAVHDRYGFKAQLNCFYRTDFFYGMDEFTMAEMPATWKAEWQANKDWLRLGMHSLQEFPDYPFVNGDYRDVKKLTSMIKGEVERFAGPGVFAKFAVVHWGVVSKEGCRALRDCGITLLQAQCGPRRAYGGDPASLPYGHAFRLLQNRKPETEVFGRISENEAIAASVSGYNNLTMVQGKAMYGKFDYLYDFETGLGMKETEDLQPLSSGINLYTPETLRAAFAKVIGNEFVIYSNHEQYFYRDYFAYQPDYLDKLMLAAKILTENGYAYGFAEELVVPPSEECPVNKNIRGHENVEWSTSYAYHLTDENRSLPRVLLVGDSICSGYQEDVQELLEDEVNVSYWISSYCVTSPGYLRLLAFYLDEAQYDVVHLNNGLHSLETDTVVWAKAFDTALRLVRRKQPQAKIVWATSTPLKDAALTAKARNLNGVGAEVVRALGGIATNDLFALADPYDRETHWRDTYHHREELRKREAEAVAAAVRSVLPKKAIGVSR